MFGGGALTVTQSTIANNRATHNDGGVFNDGPLITTITQSTIANNTASLGGGGMFNGSTLTVTQSTIAGNTTDSGGGVYFTVIFTLVNTLVVGNSTPLFAGSNQVYNDGEGNLVGVPAGFTLGQVVQVDGSGVPLLADNGGPTKTIALADHSPAQDAGLDANASSFATDQRGQLWVVFAHVDVGAVESQVPPPLPLAVAVGTEMTVTDATIGTTITTLHPFPGFGGLVSAVVADFTGDGAAGYAVGAGPGGGPHVKVFDGRTGMELESYFVGSSDDPCGVFVG